MDLKTIDSFFGENRYLSNFYPTAVEYGWYVYPSVENAYQAAKSTDHDVRRQFINITAGQAKRLGRTIEIRKDWENVKDRIMYELVYKKFENNDLIRKLLLETGYSTLIEGNNWGDTYWGVCKGEGQNKLGKILMLVRSEFELDIHCKHWMGEWF